MVHTRWALWSDEKKEKKLATVIVGLFSLKEKAPTKNIPVLSGRLVTSLIFQVDSADNMHCFLRGNSLACKVMTYCFKFFGTCYLQEVISPLLQDLFREENIQCSYEVDPTKLERNEKLEDNQANLIALTDRFFNTITASSEKIVFICLIIMYNLVKLI